MVAVMSGMFVVMMISVAAIAAASGDIGLARTDQDDKQAYAAAEAGINDYLGNLNTDTNYWAKCTNTCRVPREPEGRDRLRAQVADVPGSTDSRVLDRVDPGTGQRRPASAADPVNSMVDEGNIRIRSTGRVKSTHRHTARSPPRSAAPGSWTSSTTPISRTRIPHYIQRTAWSRGSRATDSSGNPTGGDDLVSVGGRQVPAPLVGHPGQRRRRPPGEARLAGAVPGPRRAATRRCRGFDDRYDDVDTDDICGEITFITGDEVNGPFHSNDDILVSGSPRFGTPDGNDRVEISGRPGSAPTSANPQFHPTLREPAPPSWTRRPPTSRWRPWPIPGTRSRATPRSCCRERP